MPKVRVIAKKTPTGGRVRGRDAAGVPLEWKCGKWLSREVSPETLAALQADGVLSVVILPEDAAVDVEVTPADENTTLRAEVLRLEGEIARLGESLKASRSRRER